MSFRDIQIILDTRLNAIKGALPVAWENVALEPVLGSPWLRPTLLNAPSSTLDFNYHQENPGVYRIDVFYPLKNGHRDLMDKLDEIYNHFKAIPTLTLNQTVVYIQNVSMLPKVIDDAWIMGSLDVNYTNYDCL